MEKIINADISEMPGLNFACTCGRDHSVGIEKLSVGKDVIKGIPDIVSGFRDGELFLIYDKNTKQVLGEKVEQLLLKSGYNTSHFLFEDTPKQLIPDEKAIGRLMVEIGEKTSLILAVGSGTINDLARIISHKLKIPYVIAATAPSMDGYASTVSPLIINGFKKTYEAVYPYAIVADTGILREAPHEMLCAGFGDILGKYTALSDWELSLKQNGEYFCPISVAIMRKAVKKCIDSVDNIKTRDDAAIKHMIDALILSGIAMGMVGNSRPASGAEHHLAHYWEMDALAKNMEHPLHGNSVGVGTVIMSSVYELVEKDHPTGIDVPKPETIRSLLLRVGACDNPRELGISRELFYRSILYAKEVRPRYTVLQYVYDRGLLEKYAQIVTNRFYD